MNLNLGIFRAFSRVSEKMPHSVSAHVVFGSLAPCGMGCKYRRLQHGIVGQLPDVRRFSLAICPCASFLSSIGLSVKDSCAPPGLSHAYEPIPRTRALAKHTSFAGACATPDGRLLRQTGDCPTRHDRRKRRRGTLQAETSP